jgi:hypothetical protein
LERREGDSDIGEVEVEDQTVVTSDDQKLGTVVAERDRCVVIETGHVFKTKHAIPREFLHEVDGENWDCEAVRLHYGLDGPFQADADANDLESAETDALRAGIKPAPVERLEVLEEHDPNALPAVRERQPNAADPGGVGANLD